MLDSIGCAIYNRADLLQRLIDSIDYPVGRFIIVNNGSLNLPEYRNENVATFEVLSPGMNLGCAGGWNMIQDKAFTQLGLNSVLIVGNDIQWMPGDLDKFKKTLVDFSAADFIFGNHSYSNFLVKRSGWEKVGAFDETFFPAYLEDSSHWQTIRMLDAKAIHVAGLNSVHEGSSTINADSRLKKEVSSGHEKNWEYYSRRYGCPKWSHAAETFKHPFNDPEWPPNKWVLSKDRLRQPHYFKQWPQ